MKSRFTVAAAILVLAFGGACADGKLRSTQVESAIAAGNLKGVLTTYFDCAKYQGTAYEAIATGAQEWVSIAVRVLPMADACYAEGIVSALGQAMQQKPENVLPLVGKSDALAPRHICLPSISDELPLEIQRQEILKSKNAINGAKGFPDQKAACLRFIASVEQRLVGQH